jgi:hypothetical protein
MIVLGFNNILIQGVAGYVILSAAVFIYSRFARTRIL